MYLHCIIYNFSCTINCVKNVLNVCYSIGYAIVTSSMSLNQPHRKLGQSCANKQTHVQKSLVVSCAIKQRSKDHKHLTPRKRAPRKQG